MQVRISVPCLSFKSLPVPTCKSVIPLWAHWAKSAELLGDGHPGAHLLHNLVTSICGTMKLSNDTFRAWLYTPADRNEA
jgi:hypothetical protein